MLVKERKVFNWKRLLEIHLAADDNAMFLTGQPIDFFQTDAVNFIVNVETWHVFPRPCKRSCQMVTERQSNVVYRGGHL